MFQGSIPQSLRQITAELTDSWTCQDVYVGCSGNLTVERILATSGRFRLHSNDVTIYSSTLAAYFAGQSFRVELRDEHVERFGWLRPFLGKPENILATLFLATRFADGVVKENAYYARLVEGYRHQFPTLHAATVAKILASKLRLASFYCGDVLEYVEQVPQDAGFISYPPFLQAGGYERMFKRLATLFDWDAPTYQPMKADGLKRLLATITDRQFWMFGVPERLPDYEEHLRGSTLTTLRGVPIYVYASAGRPRIVTADQHLERVPIPRLGLDDTIAAQSRISLSVLPLPMFNALRAQYLNPSIVPAKASIAFAVLIDGKLAGFFAVNTGMTLARWDKYIDTPFVYLMTDCPVAPTAYPRLAKLVLMAALSTEAKQILERAANKRMRSIVTTAFTNKAVSMKYRGLFELLIRKDTPEAHTKYALSYGAPLGQWTLAEGLALWLQKQEAAA